MTTVMISLLSFVIAEVGSGVGVGGGLVVVMVVVVLMLMESALLMVAVVMLVVFLVGARLWGGRSVRQILSLMSPLLLLVW